MGAKSRQQTLAGRIPYYTLGDRQEAPELIDTNVIPGTGAGVRSLFKEVVVAGPPSDVWTAWTTAQGIQTWWGPPEANVELRIGGPFELFFTEDARPGERGSEGCQLLAYVPSEMLAFTWNAPPHLPLRSSHTWVVISFSAVDGGTAVRLVHTGFLDGPDWDDYMAYFENAWGYVLELLVSHWTDD